MRIGSGVQLSLIHILIRFAISLFDLAVFMYYFHSNKKMKLVKEKDNIIISVKNTYDGKLNIKDGEIQTSKKYEMDEHGVGIKGCCLTDHRRNLPAFGSFDAVHDGQPLSFLRIQIITLVRVLGEMCIRDRFCRFPNNSDTLCTPEPIRI